MISITYLNFPFAKVKDKTSFFKENVKEVRQFNSIYQAAKLLLGVPAHRIDIEVAEGKRIYKLDFLYPEPNRSDIIGTLFYIPEERRLDIYDSSRGQTPLIQVVGRHIVYKGFSIFMERLGLDTIFKPLINLI